MRKVYRILALLFVSAMLAAVILQDHTPLLPLGLFNEGRAAYRIASLACLAVLLFASGTLLIESMLGGSWRIAGAVRGVLVFYIIVNVLLVVFDRAFVSRSPGNELGGPYYEIATPRGERLFLKKPFTGSPLGFRTYVPYRKDPGRTRILFLGDSYAEGSGHGIDCNYPNVVERYLNSRLPDSVEVMNAGVGGYGPRQSLALFRYLVDEGYRVDIAVLNIFMENDVTDDLPGTERRVVAGVVLRYPRNPFLAVFHPLNSHLARYALVLRRLGSISTQKRKAIIVERGPCDYSSGSGDISPWALDYMRRRLDILYRAAGSKDLERDFTSTLAAFRARAEELGIPFVVVLFPARIAADVRARDMLAPDEELFASTMMLHRWVYEALPGVPIIEVGETLADRPGMYRQADTHLSDAGNVRAGEYVGERLLELYERGAEP